MKTECYGLSGLMSRHREMIGLKTGPGKPKGPGSQNREEEEMATDPGLC